MAARAPNEISDLEVWYRASDETAYSNNDPVPTATDQSGNGRNATQATGSKQPLWIEDGLGGQAVYRFDGSNDRLVTGALSFAQPNTILLVGYLHALPSGSYPLVDGITSTARHWVGFSDAGFVPTTWRMYCSAWSWQDGQPLAQTGRFSLGAIFNGASSSMHDRPLKMRTGNPGTHACGGLSIGSRWDNAQFVQMDLAELALFSRALTRAELNDFEAYVAEQYGHGFVVQELESYADGGTKWAYGLMASNGDIYGAPFTTQSVLKIDPDTGTVSTIGPTTDDRWVGFVESPQGYLYALPEQAETVLKLDPDDDSFSEFGSGLGHYYGGCVATANGKIYCAPFRTNNVLVIDPATDTTATIASGLTLITGGIPGDGAWAWFIEAPNGKLYAVPRTAETVLVVDPSDDSDYEFGSGDIPVGMRKWAGGILHGTRIYCYPRDAESVLVIETADDSVYFITGLPAGENKWHGSIQGTDSTIYMAPRQRNDVLAVDPSDDSWELIDLHFARKPGRDKWVGVVRYNASAMLLVPHDSPSVITLGADGLLPEEEAEPTLSVVAVSQSRIDVTMGAASGATDHYLYRSTVPLFTPSPATLIASYGATPAALVEDTGLVSATWYYYALVAVVGGSDVTVRDAAATLGYNAPILYVAAITDTTASLSVSPLEEYLEVRFLTRDSSNNVVDLTTQTGPYRWLLPLTGLTPLSTYTSWVQVRYASEWSGWSDPVVWQTQPGGWTDSDGMGCPPVWSGIHHNPDGNAWDRLGRGFFRPLPGQPLRGKAASVVFRWHSSTPRWNIRISDDLGETWSTIATNVAASGTDGDRLVRYPITLDTTGYADGMDYRLRAVSTNLDPVVTWESMSFAIDNAGDVHWWKAQLGDPETDKWGKLWAQTGQTWTGANTGDPIWYRGADGGIGAIKGHDYSALVDRELPESYGADATVRYYIWSGEGGMIGGLQGRDDTENFHAGLVFFAQGASTGARQGVFVGLGNTVSWLAGCCSDYLTSGNAAVAIRAVQTPGGGLVLQDPGTLDPTDPLPKMWFRAMRKPWQVVKEGTIIIGSESVVYTDAPTGGALVPWPVMTWRNGPEPGDDIHSGENTCARRWEMYSQRTRVEVDPLDYKRLRVRVRLDGPGVEEPEGGYWHVDTWIEASAEWERGTTGLCSQQTAMDLYGTPNGARVFFSLSVLPLEPDEPPLIPPVIIPPWNPLQEGAPCTVILQVYDDDRETVRWEVGDDPLHESPYLCVPEHYGEQELDIVNGAATIGQVEVVVIDRSQTVGDQDSGWLTERLQLVHGRRNRLLRFIDYQLGWVTIADGPATAPRMDDTYAAYRWTIRDTRETERKVEAFVAATSSWLLPMGLPDGWGEHINGDGDSDWLVPPQDPLTGTYHILGGDYPRGWVDLRDYWPGPWSVHPSPNQRPVGDQAVPEDVTVLEEVEQLFTSPGEPMGDPRPVYYEWPDVEVLWRPALSGDDWTVIQPTDYIVDGESYAKPAGVDMWWPPRKLTRIWDAVDADSNEVRAATWIMLRGLMAEGDFPADTDEVEIAIRFRGKPTEFAPLHLEGLTTGELLKNLYDGVYSRPDPTTGEVAPTGIRYHEADLLQMQDPVLLRLTEPVDDARAWAEKMIYAPTGWVPALNNDGEISPKSQVPPISFAGELLIDNSVTEPQPDWSAGDRIVNVLSLTYPRYYRVDAAEADSIDRLEKRDVTHEWRDETMIDRHDIQKAEYDGSAFAAVGDEYGEPVLTLWQELGYQHALNRKLYVFDRYKNGTPIIEVPVMRTHCATLRAGDWVRVDLSWFPENTTGRRGMLCGGQILAIHDVDCAWRILLIERVVPLIEGS